MTQATPGLSSPCPFRESADSYLLVRPTASGVHLTLTRRAETALLLYLIRAVVHAQESATRAYEPDPMTLFTELVEAWEQIEQPTEDSSPDSAVRHAVAADAYDRVRELLDVPEWTLTRSQALREARTLLGGIAASTGASMDARRVTA